MSRSEITLTPRSFAGLQSALLESPHARTPKRGLRLFCLALTSAALLWLCYFPLDFGWLAWVALVPFLGLVRSSVRPRWLYLSAFLSGLAFHLAAIQWMRVADWRMYFTWIGLSFYCTLYFLPTLYFIRFLDRHTSLPLVLSVPVVWTALEFLRSTFGGGFAWYLLSHTQHDTLPIVQIADVTGAYGVSFLIAAVNGLLFEVLWSRAGVRHWLNGPDTAPRWPRIHLLVQGLAVIVALLSTVGYGFWRLGQDRFTPGPRVALVQGNLDQRIKNQSAVEGEAAKTMNEHYIALSDLAASYRPDLIVWPETSLAEPWIVSAEGKVSGVSREMARDAAARWHTNVLIGMNTAVVENHKPLRRYNSAVFIDRKGEPGARYDKIHRVPFGEYMPFRESLPWMDKLSPYDFDYSVWPGQDHVRIALPETQAGRGFTFGALICYEDSDAEVARPYVGDSARPPVDFLVNVSNDGWFDGTSEHDQHLAICRFRAIESRRSVVRSVNMGISAVIDSNGRVLRSESMPVHDPHFWPYTHVWMTPEHQKDGPELAVRNWGWFKKRATVLIADVPIDDRVSLYARLGDWLPILCWLILGGSLGFALARRRLKPRAALP